MDDCRGRGLTVERQAVATGDERNVEPPKPNRGVALRTVDLPADKKSVKVEVKSPGYRSVDKKIDISGESMSVEFETVKRSSTPTVRPPKRPDRPPSGGGGLIDI